MPTFEEQLKTLETVVEKLEHGDLPLEESLSLFEQGVTLSDACKKELEAAEGRVQVLLQPATAASGSQKTLCWKRIS